VTPRNSRADRLSVPAFYQLHLLHSHTVSIVLFLAQCLLSSSSYDIHRPLHMEPIVPLLIRRPLSSHGVHCLPPQTASIVLLLQYPLSSSHSNYHPPDTESIVLLLPRFLSPSLTQYLLRCSCQLRPSAGCIAPVTSCNGQAADFRPRPLPTASVTHTHTYTQRLSPITACRQPQPLYIVDFLPRMIYRLLVPALTLAPALAPALALAPAPKCRRLKSDVDHRLKGGKCTCGGHQQFLMNNSSTNIVWQLSYGRFNG